MLAVLCLAVLATRVTALHPEQLEQQRLQLESSRIQTEISRLHQAIQVSEGATRVSQRQRQQDLHVELQRIQDRQQELQIALQERLSGSDPSLSPQNSLHDELQRGVRQEVVLPCETVDGDPGLCRPLRQCLRFYADLPLLRRSPCPLGREFNGVCCPRFSLAQPRQEPGLISVKEEEVLLPFISFDSLQEAVELSKSVKAERFEFVNLLKEAGVVQEKGSPVELHTKFFPTTKESLERGEQGRTVVDASSALASQHNLTPEQAAWGLPKFSLLNTSLADTCPKPIHCPPSKYRTFDGSCNNLKHPHWGKADTAFQRILTPHYLDGVNKPRTKSVDGSDLPSARIVSTKVLSGPKRESPQYADMLTQMGQFFDHDIAQTPISRGKDGAGLICCVDGKPIDRRFAHPDCMPIHLPRDDKVFGPLGSECMDFVRSLPCPREDCHFGPREQMNVVSNFIDCSNVYGSDQATHNSLRKFEDGLMATQKAMGGKTLPPPSNQCSDHKGNQCFHTGDARVNVQPGLAAMHIIWLREHNRIAKELKKLHPTWSDEQLFQEARRIVAAIMQHIIYNEFIPAIIGSELCYKFDLIPSFQGYRETYKEKINPGITNAFSTACFRFGHSLVRNKIETHTKHGNLKYSCPLSESHFGEKLQILYHEEGLDDLMAASCNNKANEFDKTFADDAQNRLFKGMDLMSLNIQRGRDHGLPPYVEWRKVCQLPPIKSWEDMSNNYFDQDGVNNMRKVYSSPKDIDLFAGMLMEKPVHGGMVGSTASCIILDQFVRLLKGDRYWYELPNLPWSFTPEQLKEIKKVRMSRIICNNGNGVHKHIQPWVFAIPSTNNQKVHCDEYRNIPQMSFKPWENMKL